MAGQFDIRRSAPSSATWPSAEDDDAASLHGTVRSTRLEVVSELEEQHPAPLDIELAQAFSSAGEPPSPSSARTGGRRTTRRTGSTRTASPKGETLADLPVAGPGWDLAAELGRAEGKDLVNGFSDDQSNHKSAVEVVDQKEFECAYSSNSPLQSGRRSFDISHAALRSENKALKDANKALSLYASKILDRIIGHGGFESVLAADGDPAAGRTPPPPPSPVKKPRPQSMSFLRSLGGGGTLASPVPLLTPDPSAPAPPENTPSKDVDPSVNKRGRRGLSIDWSKISIWASPNASSDPPTTEQQVQDTPTQATAVGTARKLDLPEDEEDRIARARLNAEMRLHGIEKDGPTDLGVPLLASSSLSITSADSLPPPTGASSSASIRSAGSDNAGGVETAATTPPTSFKNRLPFFSRASSGTSSSVPTATPLTSETLQQAEAEANIAAHDAREKALVEEIAKDPVRTTSLTEMPSVRPGSSLSERHRRRKSGGSQHSVKSGASTLFSAGRMSVEGVGEEADESVL